MAEPAGIFSAFEPVDVPHAAASAPPKYDFGLDTLGNGWKGGSAGTDWGLHQSAYAGDISDTIRAEARKRGIDTPPYAQYDLTMFERRVKAAGGNLNALNLFERQIYERSHQFWGRIAQERKKDPAFLKDFPMVFDEDSLQAEARRRRQVDEAASNEIYAQSTTGGKVAWWLGSFGTAAKDPLSYIPLGSGAKAEATIGQGILKGFGRGAAANAGITLAIEPAVRLDASSRGQDRTLKETAIDVGLSGVFGGLIEGAHGGLEAKFNITPDEKAAAHVVNRDAEIRSASPFHSTPAGDAEHGTRLAATIAALEAGRPAPKFKTQLQAGTSLAGGAERFRAMVDVAEGRTKNPLSSANGYFQFTDKTWLSYYKREIGAGGLSDAEILKKKTDRPTATRLFEALTKDNQAMLRAAGLPDSETNLYLAHFLGPKSLRVLRAAPETPVESLLPHEFITANPRVLKHKTAGEVIAWADRKMGGEGVVVEAPDTPLLREDHFADEGAYREALAQETSFAAPESGPDFALRETAEPSAATPSNIPALEPHSGSWVVVSKETGEPVFETFNADTAGKVNQEKYEVLTAQQWLGRFNRRVGGEGEALAPGTILPQSLDLARSGSAEIGNTTIDYTSRGDVAEISMVKTPEGLRGQGSARNAMEQFVAAADRSGVDLYLTPEPVGAKGASKTALTQFYKSLGFEPVTNRTRDFRVKGTMVRKARPVEGGPSSAPATEAVSPNEVIPDAVVRETEAEGPHFEDPNGPDAVAQADSTIHDLIAEDLGDTSQFRIAEEGKEITVADALENIAKDEAAIKALKDCL